LTSAAVVTVIEVSSLCC